MIIILIKLILAHLIGDFPLQPAKYVEAKENKKIKSWELYAHVFLHGVLALFILGDWMYWHVALSIVAGHLFIDIIKIYLQKEATKPTWFIIDQALHLLVIIGIWALWFQSGFSLIKAVKSDSFITIITALFFLTQPMALIMKAAMKKWSDALKKEKEESLDNAGKFIGILERLLVFVFILNSQWEAVGFLLAAKSVFRFGDLRKSKDRKLTEYVLIGTLISFSIAFLTGMIVNRLLNS